MYTKNDILILSSVLIISIVIMLFVSYSFEKKVDEINKRIDILQSVTESRLSSIKSTSEQSSYEFVQYKNVQNDIQIKTSKNNDPDLKILAQLIEAESGTQSFEGKLAVGAVVMNRVKSDQFPDNVRDVIFQKNQFSVVNNGRIYNEPSEESVRAAKVIIEGARILDSNVLYFYNPKLVRLGNWIRSRKTTKRIGDHVFAI